MRPVEPGTDLLPIVSDALRACAHPAPRSAIVVGVSGGPDSMALLDLLARLAQRPRHRWRLVVAHLNHRLRGAESDEDEAFVRAEAAHRGLEIHVGMIAPDSRSTAIEERARRARYSFFEHVCAASASRDVALGHQADDQVETILFRLLRGTGLRGVGGMRAVRALRERSDIRIIRPLLGVRRARIIEYLHARGIACRIDASNELDAFARNRIRRHVLPQLRETLPPRFAESLLRIAEDARAIDSSLTAAADGLLAAALRRADEDSLCLATTGLTQVHPLVRAEVVRCAAARLGLREGRLSALRLRAAADVLGGSTAGACIELPGGVRLLRRDGEVRFERRRAIQPAPLDETVIAVPGVTELRGAGLRLRAELTPVLASVQLPVGQGSPLIEHVDFERLVLPLRVRARLAGERFSPLGAPGRRKLSDFMIDCKIARNRRAQTPILCDAAGVVWVIPHRIDTRVRLTPASRRVLRLQVEPASPVGPAVTTA